LSEQLDRLTAALADRYAIERELGAGGMATVYLAQDLKHHRQVAVKVLRPELAAIVGAERFLKEIEVTANLQHPNILPLYDSGQAGDGGQFLYYVMPFVEGESLRDRLDREKQLGIEESLRIAQSVAGALDNAHRHEVIHRDIKPENIMLTDGQALVADFGIALAVSQAGGTRLTETGLSLGTPYYMSPEQATGDRELDARSDVYALGCVTYEMVTGDPPHTGATAQAIIASVMTEEPRPVTVRRPSVPAHVAAAVHKAIAKIPADRFSTAAQFSDALVSGGQVAPSFLAPPTPGVRVGPWNRLSIVMTAVAAALVAYVAFDATRTEPPGPVIRYSLALPLGEELAANVVRPRVVLSPDGDKLLYIAAGDGVVSRLRVRERDALVATELFGTERAQGAFFSPDGTRFGFVRPARGTQELMVASFSGGPPLLLIDTLVGMDGASWGTDEFVYYDGLTGGGTRGIMRIPAAGGASEQVTTVDTARGESDHVWPQILPDANGLLFTVIRDNNLTDADVAVVDLKGGDYRILARGVGAKYAVSGHLLYVSTDGTLFGAPFDASQLEVTGEAVEMATGLNIRATGAVDLAVSRAGRMAYVTGGLSPRYGELAWVDRNGEAGAVDSGWVENFRSLSVSPDGSQLAVSIRVADYGGQTQVFTRPLTRGPPVVLTPQMNRDDFPTWSPDGRLVLFRTDRNGTGDIYARRADASAPATPVLTGSANYRSVKYSPDGRWLIYLEGEEVHARPAGPDGESMALGVYPAQSDLGWVSPDGQWLVYTESTSDELSGVDVFVVPFPNTGDAKWRISTGGGFSPRWSHSGRELFYKTLARELVSLEVPPGASFSPGRPRVLFTVDQSYLWTPASTWDVMPDDERFVMLRMRAGGVGRELIVVENFFSELRERVRD
jgi:serine/threonine-protein kinase